MHSRVLDVIVVGGGPAGLAMALALGGKGLPRPLNVAVVDARALETLRDPGSDTRGTALTLASLQMFRALGLYGDLEAHLQAMRDIKVSDSPGALSDRPSLLSFTTESGRESAASIIENRSLNAALVQGVSSAPAIDLIAGETVVALTHTAGQATLTCQSGRHLSAPLVIGAVGRNSLVRRLADVTVESRSYGQTAITFTMTHALPHHGQAEEHFSSNGVFAILPLPGQRASIVWGTDPAKAAELMALPVPDFESALNAFVGDHLGTLRLESDRQSYPLGLQLASSFIAPRVALVGDAAHVIHPLAGLGLNLGFKDVAALSDCVQDAVGRGEDHGSPMVLERYQQWRRFDTVATVAAMEALNGLFVNDVPGLRALRQAGLHMVNRLPMAKANIMREASGLGGVVPRLMRGITP